MSQGIRYSAILLLGAVLSSASVKSQNTQLVIRNVTVIDGTGAAPKPGQDVIVSGHRIAAVEPSGNRPVPDQFEIVDGTGKFLLPGLWDMHVHLSKAGENTLPLFIANGVTGVRDMGGDLQQLSQWRREIEAGKRLGPHIKMAGPMLEASTNIARMQREGGVEPFERFRIGVAGPEEAEAVVGQLARTGVDFIKLRTVSSVETYRALGAAARKYHLALVGHAVAPPEEILSVGQQSVEHGFFPPLTGYAAEERRDLFSRFAQKGIAVVPTLVVGKVLLTPYPRMKAIADDAAGKIEPKRKYLSGYLIRDWKEQVEEQKEPWPGMSEFLTNRVNDLRQMLQAGVHVMPGTDTAVLLIWPGYSLHEELRLMVDQLGMTSMQAIVSATRWPTELLGIQNTVGTIAPGRLADLVLLEANPVEDIQNTTRIAAVIREGQVFPKKVLEGMLTDVATRAAEQP